MRRLLRLLLSGALLATVAAPPVAANNSPCQNTFAQMAAIPLPAGYWSVDEHWYEVDFYDPAWGFFTLGPVNFTVSATAPLIPGPVFLRMSGLSSTPGAPVPVPDNTINPAQPTVLYGGFVFFPGDAANMTEARQAVAGATVSFASDLKPEAVPASLGPITNACAQAGVYTPSNGVLHVTGQLSRAYVW